MLTFNTAVHGQASAPILSEPWQTEEGKRHRYGSRGTLRRPIEPSHVYTQVVCDISSHTWPWGAVGLSESMPYYDVMLQHFLSFGAGYADIMRQCRNRASNVSDCRRAFSSDISDRYRQSSVRI